jgi:hypothetical protein
MAEAKHSHQTRCAQADGTYCAYEERLHVLKDLIVRRGGFQREEAIAALTSDDPLTKEPVARWLSVELEKLRDGDGKAPVRNKRALSRLVISDLAFTMLECNCTPGDELLFLLQQLLNVDRHRATVAEASASRDDMALTALIDALAALAGLSPSLRDLAKVAGVSLSTVSAWRKSAEYRRHVAFQKQFNRGLTSDDLGGVDLKTWVKKGLEGVKRGRREGRSSLPLQTTCPSPNQSLKDWEIGFDDGRRISVRQYLAGDAELQKLFGAFSRTEHPCSVHFH